MPIRPETEKKLTEIFRLVLNLGDVPIPPDLSQSSQEGWDSLAHTLLVAGVESEFGVVIDTADAMELTSYRSFARYLEEKGQ